MAGGRLYPTGWLNGALVSAGEVRLPMFSPGVAFAAAVFEGIRGYRGADGRAHLFRLGDHLDRLAQGAKILGLDEVPRPADVAEAILAMLRADGVAEDCYVRPHVYVDGEGDMAATGPTGLAILARPRPQLTKRLETGLRCQVSSWRRVADNASPPRVKAAANYFNGRLAGLQAKADGYDTALILTEQGQVSEAPGACLLAVRDGVLIAPPVTAGILESITRDTVLWLAREAGIAVQERPLDRTELYVCAEAMLVGTGAEITPVVGIDRLAVGDGARGPVTRALQERYFALVRGEAAAPDGWLKAV
jgi:branched-chain amino acid aminotransferase